MILLLICNLISEIQNTNTSLSLKDINNSNFQENVLNRFRKNSPNTNKSSFNNNLNSLSHNSEDQFYQNFLTNDEIKQILKCFGDLNLREGCVICRYIMQKIYKVLDITSMCPDIVETQLLSQKNREWKPDPDIMNKWVLLYNMQKDYVKRIKPGVDKFLSYDKVLHEEAVKKKVQLENMANLIQFQNKVNQDISRRNIIEKNIKEEECKDKKERDELDRLSPDFLSGSINKKKNRNEIVNNNDLVDEGMNLEKDKSEKQYENYYHIQRSVNNIEEIKSKSNSGNSGKNDGASSLLNSQALSSKVRDFMGGKGVFKFKQTNTEENPVNSNSQNIENNKNNENSENSERIEFDMRKNKPQSFFYDSPNQENTIDLSNQGGNNSFNSSTNAFGYFNNFNIKKDSGFDFNNLLNNPNISYLGTTYGSPIIDKNSNNYNNKGNNSNNNNNGNNRNNYNRNTNNNNYSRNTNTNNNDNNHFNNISFMETESEINIIPEVPKIISKSSEDYDKDLFKTLVQRNRNFNLETMRRGRRRSRFPDPQWDCVETQIAKLLRYLCEEELSISYQKYCKPLFHQISTIVESFLYHDNNIEICQNVHMCPVTASNLEMN